MIEQRVRTSEQRFATQYLYPLETTLITATTEAAAQLVATVRGDSLGKVERFVVGNNSASPADFTAYFIPSGSSVGAENREVTAIEVAATSNLDLTDLIGGLYAPGAEIRVFASTADALIVMGYIRGVL